MWGIIHLWSPGKITAIDIDVNITKLRSNYNIWKYFDLTLKVLGRGRNSLDFYFYLQITLKKATTFILIFAYTPLLQLLSFHH